MENNNNHDRLEQKVDDTEFAQEMAAHSEETSYANNDTRRDEADKGRGWSIAGIIFSILSFFLWPYLMAPVGIILGIIGVGNRNSLGWWAIGIGVIALILVTIFMIFAIPFRIIF